MDDQTQNENQQPTIVMSSEAGKKKPFSIFVLASVFAGIIIVIAIIFSVNIVQQNQDNRSNAKTTPVPTAQKVDSGQVPTEDQIKNGEVQVVEDTSLEPPTTSVKGAQTSQTGSYVIYPSNNVLGISDSPVVSIDNPKPGPTLPRYTAVQIVATASDQSGIQSISISVNDQVIKTCTKVTICSVWRTFSSASAETVYTLKAVAVTNTGNTATATAEVCREGQSCSGVVSTPIPTPTSPPPTPTPTNIPNATSTPTPIGGNDTTPPTIIFQRPPINGYLVTNDMSGARIDATASDTSGIKKMEMYLSNTNGRRLLTSTTQANIGYYILLRDLTVGTNTNTVEIRAYDRVDNINTATRLISRSSTAGSTPTPTYVPTSTPRAGSSPTPTPRLSITPTVSLPPGVYPFTISGSTQYVSAIRSAIEYMKKISPADYQLVAQNVREIREGSNLAYVGSRMIQVSTASSLTGKGWAGGTIVHETWHVINFYAGKPYIGCVGEADSLRKQEEYLKKAGEGQFASYVHSLIGHWPPGYDCSYCITTTCKP